MVSLKGSGTSPGNQLFTYSTRRDRAARVDHPVATGCSGQLTVVVLGHLLGVLVTAIAAPRKPVNEHCVPVHEYGPVDGRVAAREVEYLLLGHGDGRERHNTVEQPSHPGAAGDNDAPGAPLLLACSNDGTCVSRDYLRNRRVVPDDGAPPSAGLDAGGNGGGGVDYARFRMEDDRGLEAHAGPPPPGLDGVE